MAKNYIFGEFKAMWLMCLFDLPVETEFEKREYTRFRKFLKSEGFYMIQYSVYIRPCPSQENLETHRQRIERSLPENGEVRLIPFTDYQFRKMHIFYSRRRKKVEDQPKELWLFSEEELDNGDYLE